MGGCFRVARTVPIPQAYPDTPSELQAYPDTLAELMSRTRFI